MDIQLLIKNMEQKGNSLTKKLKEAPPFPERAFYFGRVIDEFLCSLKEAIQGDVRSIQHLYHSVGVLWKVSSFVKRAVRFDNDYDEVLDKVMAEATHLLKHLLSFQFQTMGDEGSHLMDECIRVLKVIDETAQGCDGSSAQEAHQDVMDEEEEREKDMNMNLAAYELVEFIHFLKTEHKSDVYDKEFKTYKQKMRGEGRFPMKELDLSTLAESLGVSHGY